MNPITRYSTTRLPVRPGEKRTFIADFRDDLASSETLSGSESASCSVGSPLIENVDINAAEVTDSANHTTGVGKGVVFTISNLFADDDGSDRQYPVEVTATTSAGQILKMVCPVVATLR